MNWFQKNFKTIIYVAFLVPILTVAFVSISHVTKWYGLSNPVSWAIYLSVGIEIAALSALAAISAQMGKKVYFPFGIVTLIQFIGNIFFAYQYIDVTSQSFKDWIDLVDPLVSYLGVEAGDPIGHKRFLALFSGGMLPIISLSFLHMLVKFEEEEKNKVVEVPSNIDIDALSIEAGKQEALIENEKYNPTEED
jgi:phosphoglycerol transferase MdoB-like AlkP superfamily enzyme